MPISAIQIKARTALVPPTSATVYFQNIGGYYASGIVGAAEVEGYIFRVPFDMTITKIFSSIIQGIKFETFSDFGAGPTGANVSFSLDAGSSYRVTPYTARTFLRMDYDRK
jgi:hypothetical protein